MKLGGKNGSGQYTASWKRKSGCGFDQNRMCAHMKFSNDKFLITANLENRRSAE